MVAFHRGLCGGKIPGSLKFDDLPLAFVVDIQPGLEREQSVRPGLNDRPLLLAVV